MGVEPRLIGRLLERTQLASGLESAVQAEPMATLVCGEPGIGKTALTRELVTLARARDFHVLSGQCLRFGADVTGFLPLSQALASWLARTNSSARGAHFADARAVGDLVPALSGSTAADSGSVILQFGSVIWALCQDRPTLLVIEDLHWADPSSLNVLSYLIAGLTEGQRLHVHVTYRDTELGEGHRLHGWLADVSHMPSVRRLPLSRLDLWQTEQLVLQHAGSYSAALAERIYERSGGNPYLIELLVAQSGAGEDVAVGRGNDLREALLATWHRLSPAARTVTQVLAVSGRPVSYSLLSGLVEMTGVGATQFKPALANATAQGITLDTESGDVWFRHPLLAEVVGGTLSAPERASLELTWITAWESAVGVSERDRANHLALHYAAVQDADRCFAWSLRAADEAAQINAPGEEYRHLSTAVGLLPALSAEASDQVDAVSLFTRAASAAELAGEYREAQRQYQHALDRIDRHREPLAAARILLPLAFLQDNLEASSRLSASLLPQALQLTAAFPLSEERAICLSHLALDEAWEGVGAAAAHAEEAVRLAEHLGAPKALAWALAVRSQTRWYTEEGIADAARAVAMAEELGDTELVSRSSVFLSNNYEDTGQWAAAAEVTRKAYLLVRNKGQHTHAANVGCIAADWFLELGRWDEARAMIREILSFQQSNRWAGFSRCVAARLAGLEGNLDAAAMHLQRARELIPRLTAVGDLRLVSEVHFAIASGDPSLALDLVEQHIGDAVRVQPGAADEYLHYAARAAGDLAESGNSALTHEARTRLRRIEKLRGDRPPLFLNRGPLDLVHPALASLYAADRSRCVGDLGEQTRLWHAAVAATERAGLRYEHARALYFLGHALLTQRQGRPAAVDALSQSRAQAIDLGARPLARLVEDLATQAHLRLGGPVPDTNTGSTQPLAHLSLTRREREILRHVVAGETYAQIAAALFISPKTVSVHVSNLLRKSGTSSRIELASLARQPAKEPAVVGHADDQHGIPETHRP
ncbi:AAA family ATPase [Knoellia sp. 3-2P3]|uniref:helix-turn-helix transcriptional regulator n=1 Tax=unclassified Knoellia TaxID=2618719 RepID=UPI0023DC7152|nr:LuxR family transcriptional regulator [Knoellia sp. 3-2P3]MDF2090845.1 AAA family ATPase [Knoellia sp. 3-2P3]